MAPTVADWVGIRLAGTSYRIVRRLGEAGLFELFQAEDAQSRQPALIKALSRSALQSRPDLAHALRRDLPSLQSLAHASLQRVLTSGDHDGIPFLALSPCPAANLWQRLSIRPASRPAATLAAWLPAVAVALDYLHAQGVIHGDVQPLNVLFDGGGRAFLAEPSLLRPRVGSGGVYGAGEGPVLLPNHFMAPELMNAQAVDPRADQYALAMLVWECLCGRSLFTGETHADIRSGQQHLFSLPTWLPEVWMPAFRKALSPAAATRFATCQEFASALLSRIDNNGAPILDASPPEDFSLLCGDSETRPDYHRPTILDLPESRPALVAPSLPPMLMDPERPRRWGIVRFMGLLLLVLVAALAGGMFLPETPLHQKLTALWKPEKPAPAKPDEGLTLKGKPGEDKDPPEVKRPEGPVGPDPKVVKELEAQLASLRAEVDDAKTRRLTLVKALEDARTTSGTLERDLAKIRADMTDETGRRAAAEAEARRERESLSTARTEVTGLQGKIAALEAKVRAATSTSGDATASRLRAEAAERELNFLKADLAAAQTRVSNAEARIANAENAHKDFKAWFLVTNDCRFPVEFETRTKSWDGGWSGWIKHRLESGGNIRIFCHGNIGIELRYDFRLGDPFEYDTQTISAEMRPSFVDPTVEMLDCRYLFVLRNERIDLDFLFSVPK